MWASLFIMETCQSYKYEKTASISLSFGEQIIRFVCITLNDTVINHFQSMQEAKANLCKIVQQLGIEQIYMCDTITKIFLKKNLSEVPTKYINGIFLQDIRDRTFACFQRFLEHRIYQIQNHIRQPEEAYIRVQGAHMIFITETSDMHWNCKKFDWENYLKEAVKTFVTKIFTADDHTMVWLRSHCSISLSNLYTYNEMDNAILKSRIQTYDPKL